MSRTVRVIDRLATLLVALVLLGAGAAAKHIASAKDGDVIIAHINQPTHEAGEGVVRGLLALKARGVIFTRLDDPAFTAPSN